MRVTVVVPCRNEVAHINACLDSVAASAYPSDLLEVLVVDGGSTDGTRAIVAARAADWPNLRLLDNPRAIVPAALNLGIRAATGDVIIRMDAHVVYPPDYIPRLVEGLQRHAADNVGGRLETLPSGSGAVARAIAVALAHPFGVGNASFRIGASGPRYVDTVPFGCYRREVFQQVGMFDEDLVRNQDDEFNHRLIRHGGGVLLLPDIVAYYYARPTLTKLARMYYQYGYYKPLAARKVGRVTTFRQLVPAALVAGLVGASLMSPFWQAARILAALQAALYALAVAVGALSRVQRHGPACALALVATFPVLHFSYGTGFLHGCARLLLPRRSAVDPTTVPLSR